MIHQNAANIVLFLELPVNIVTVRNRELLCLELCLGLGLANYFDPITDVEGSPPRAVTRDPTNCKCKKKSYS
jgi:hypothetical protein